jgi:hypothetical protein
MTLKPQDVFVQLKIVAHGERKWTFASLAHELSMSVSEVHAAVKRAVAARLMDPSRQVPVYKALEEFLVHGVKYAFPPDRGGLTRGLPTGYAAAPLSQIFAPQNELPPVWSDPEGNVQGFEFSPLYRTASVSARADSKFYELLALVDAIRDGRAREREVATQELKLRLRG